MLEWLYFGLSLPLRIDGDCHHIYQIGIALSQKKRRSEGRIFGQMEVSSNGGSPCHHPFLSRIFCEIDQSAIGIHMTMESPYQFTPCPGSPSHLPYSAHVAGHSLHRRVGEPKLFPKNCNARGSEGSDRLSFMGITWCNGMTIVFRNHP